MTTDPTAQSTPTSERDALRFFDPWLAEKPYGPDVVACLLVGTPPATEVHIPDGDLRVLIERVRYHRLEPQFIEAARQGWLGFDGDQQASIAQRSIKLALFGLELERLLITAGSILDSVGVDFLVLKGMATRQLDHSSGTMRQAVDVDLLVRETAYETAGDALLEAGFSPPSEATTLMDKGGAWRLPNGLSVDLHTRPHTAGRNAGQHWWATAEEFEVAGNPFRAFSRGGRLGHAASHLALSFPNHRVLSSLGDLYRIVDNATDGDRDEAERFLAELGVSDLVARITARSAAIVGDDRVVIGEAGNRTLDRILRRAYDRPDLDKVALKLAKAYGMPWSGRRRVVKNWLFPSESYLEAGGYRSRLDRVSSVAARRKRASSRGPVRRRHHLLSGK